jgi:hypothetical protein
MRTHPFLCTPWALLAAIAAGACVARADLAQTSPFLPSNLADAAAQGGVGGPVELRGVMSTSQGTEFCIYDVLKKSSAWVGLNESGNAFVVKSADPSGDNVTVEYQGRTMRLTLRTAKVASAGQVIGVQAGNPMSVTQSVVLNPSAADEQRRLDAVAAEVRRRRQEREKAAQAAQASANGPGGAALPLPGR